MYQAQLTDTSLTHANAEIAIFMHDFSWFSVIKNSERCEAVAFGMLQ